MIEDEGKVFGQDESRPGGVGRSPSCPATAALAISITGAAGRLYRSASQHAATGNNEDNTRTRQVSQARGVTKRFLVAPRYVIGERLMILFYKDQFTRAPNAMGFTSDCKMFEGPPRHKTCNIFGSGFCGDQPFLRVFHCFRKQRGGPAPLPALPVYGSFDDHRDINTGMRYVELAPTRTEIFPKSPEHGPKLS